MSRQPPVISDGIHSDITNIDIGERVEVASANYQISWLRKLDLVAFPDGYILTTVYTQNGQRTDRYLFGHPIGKPFRSPNEFIPHLEMMYQTPAASAASSPSLRLETQFRCKCCVCKKSSRKSSSKSSPESASSRAETPFAASSRWGRGGKKLSENQKEREIANNLETKEQQDAKTIETFLNIPSVMTTFDSEIGKEFSPIISQHRSRRSSRQRKSDPTRNVPFKKYSSRIYKPINTLIETTKKRGPRPLEIAWLKIHRKAEKDEFKNDVARQKERHAALLRNRTGVNLLSDSDRDDERHEGNDSDSDVSEMASELRPDPYDLWPVLVVVQYPSPNSRIDATSFRNPRKLIDDYRPFFQTRSLFAERSDEEPLGHSVIKLPILKYYAFLYCKYKKVAETRTEVDDDRDEQIVPQPTPSPNPSNVSNSGSPADYLDDISPHNIDAYLSDGINTFDFLQFLRKLAFTDFSEYYTSMLLGQQRTSHFEPIQFMPWKNSEPIAVYPPFACPFLHDVPSGSLDFWISQSPPKPCHPVTLYNQAVIQATHMECSYEVIDVPRFPLKNRPSLDDHPLLDVSAVENRAILRFGCEVFQPNDYIWFIPKVSAFKLEDINISEDETEREQRTQYHDLIYKLSNNDYGILNGVFKCFEIERKGKHAVQQNMVSRDMKDHLKRYLLKNIELKDILNTFVDEAEVIEDLIDVVVARVPLSVDEYGLQSNRKRTRSDAGLETENYSDQEVRDSERKKDSSFSSRDGFTSLSTSSSDEKSYSDQDFIPSPFLSSSTSSSSPFKPRSKRRQSNDSISTFGIMEVSSTANDLDYSNRNPVNNQKSSISETFPSANKPRRRIIVDAVEVPASRRTHPEQPLLPPSGAESSANLKKLIPIVLISPKKHPKLKWFAKDNKTLSEDVGEDGDDEGDGGFDETKPVEKEKGKHHLKQPHCQEPPESTVPESSSIQPNPLNVRPPLPSSFFPTSLADSDSASTSASSYAPSSSSTPKPRSDQLPQRHHSNLKPSSQLPPTESATRSRREHKLNLSKGMYSTRPPWMHKRYVKVGTAMRLGELL
ncbi:hypothetical protein BKA69DRAFT_309285 [Paraphysoderma sedebokerense]|nr:hypothetical protein BKA69DRAFT_309285 [Paraphysoderma sedebokerense]